jgi:hypothetical protein
MKKPTVAKKMRAVTHFTQVITIGTIAISLTANPSIAGSIHAPKRYASEGAVVNIQNRLKNGLSILWKSLLEETASLSHIKGVLVSDDGQHIVFTDESPNKQNKTFAHFGAVFAITLANHKGFKEVLASAMSKVPRTDLECGAIFFALA